MPWLPQVCTIRESQADYRKFYVRTGTKEVRRLAPAKGSKENTKHQHMLARLASRLLTRRRVATRCRRRGCRQYMALLRVLMPVSCHCCR